MMPYETKKLREDEKGNKISVGSFPESRGMNLGDLTKLKMAMDLIITGVYEKERQKKKGEYCYSKRLIHGINLFQSLHYKYDPDGFDFSKLHEQSFLTEYAMRPVAEWFLGWKNTKKLDLENQAFYYMDALIGDTGFQTFHVNENCEDYIEYVERDVISQIEQRAVYDCLKALIQGEYVDLRKFFIEHPVISSKDLRALKMKYASNSVALQAIENAYEEIRSNCFICPKCGWTLRKEKTGVRCQSRACSEAIYIPGELELISGSAGMLRLKRGVMKYIAVPGKLELGIYQYCEKHKVQSLLWPQMDRYDIEITFSDGTVWAIDAKAVKEPYFLKESIARDGGFPAGTYDRSFYVIPDEYAAARTDYMSVINQELARLEDNQTRCIRLLDLKKEIRERGKRG